MSALPGYINRGCVNTLFLSIRKHLNVRTSALSGILLIFRTVEGRQLLQNKFFGEKFKLTCYTYKSL